MKRLIFLFLLLWALPASAQTVAGSTSKLAWDQEAPDLNTAQSYTYKIVKDGAAAVLLTGVTCAVPIPPFNPPTYTCTVPFPAFTLGAHAVSIISGNGAGDALPSVPLTFTFVVIPTPAKNLRIAG